MEGKKYKKPLDNSVKSHSGNTPVDKSTVKTDVTEPKQEIAQMEVHHHPDIHHNPKKWKEYFLEFIMIFLAVTLGFLAENLREHFAEVTKERQYIKGFLQNLKDDTARLRHVIEVDSRQLQGVDSMLKLAHADMNLDSNRTSFYALAIQHFYNSSSFTSNDATLQQLKSTGDYRLIEKDHIADSLTKYDADIHSIYSQGAYYEAYFKEILSRLDELTDVTIYADSSFLKNGKLTSRALPLLRDSDGKLPTLFNKIFDFKAITSAYVENFLKPQLRNSTTLMNTLKKVYNVED